MPIQIICIGTELLTGEILNSNFRFAAAQLNDRGLVVSREISIHDTPEAVTAVVGQALTESRLVITIGGLGPTRDDLTKQTIAELLGMPLYLDEGVAEIIKARHRAYGRKFPDSSWRQQAMTPQGAVILPNEWGTAPGLWCETAGRAVLMLPGPPREFEPMFMTYALPRVLEFVPPTVARRVLAVFGHGESNTEQEVIRLLAGYDDVEPSYCVKADRCHVRLSTPIANAARLDEACRKLLDGFGDDAAPAEENLVLLICRLLRRRGWKFGTAESCTGGGIAKEITDNAGVSDVFAGGVVTYSNELKMQLLGVSAAALEAHGAVSEPVAREMVRGLLDRYGLQAGVAVTGVAGPTGGSPEKPVGTVHIATAVGDSVRHLHRVFAYDRRGMRERTISAALNLLRDHLRES